MFRELLYLLIFNLLSVKLAAAEYIVHLSLGQFLKLDRTHYFNNIPVTLPSWLLCSKQYCEGLPLFQADVGLYIFPRYSDPKVKLHVDAYLLSKENDCLFFSRCLERTSSLIGHLNLVVRKGDLLNPQDRLAMFYWIQNITNIFREDDFYIRDSPTNAGVKSGDGELGMNLLVTWFVGCFPNASLKQATILRSDLFRDSLTSFNTKKDNPFRIDKWEFKPLSCSNISIQIIERRQSEDMQRDGIVSEDKEFLGLTQPGSKIDKSSEKYDKASFQTTSDISTISSLSTSSLLTTLHSSVTTFSSARIYLGKWNVSIQNHSFISIPVNLTDGFNFIPNTTFHIKSIIFKSKGVEESNSSIWFQVFQIEENQSLLHVFPGEIEQSTTANVTLCNKLINRCGVMQIHLQVDETTEVNITLPAGKLTVTNISVDWFKSFQSRRFDELHLNISGNGLFHVNSSGFLHSLSHKANHSKLLNITARGPRGEWEKILIRVFYVDESKSSQSYTTQPYFRVILQKRRNSTKSADNFYFFRYMNEQFYRHLLFNQNSTERLNFILLNNHSLWEEWWMNKQSSNSSLLVMDFIYYSKNHSFSSIWCHQNSNFWTERGYSLLMSFFTGNLTSHSTESTFLPQAFRLINFTIMNFPQCFPIVSTPLVTTGEKITRQNSIITTWKSSTLFSPTISPTKETASVNLFKEGYQNKEIVQSFAVQPGYFFKRYISISLALESKDIGQLSIFRQGESKSIWSIPSETMAVENDTNGNHFIFGYVTWDMFQGYSSLNYSLAMTPRFGSPRFIPFTVERLEGSLESHSFAMSFHLNENFSQYQLSEVRIVRLLIHNVNRFLDPTCEEWCVKNIAIQRVLKTGLYLNLKWGFLPFYRTKEKPVGCVMHQFRGIVSKLLWSGQNDQVTEELKKFMKVNLQVTILNGTVHMDNSTNVLSITAYTGIPFIYNVTQMIQVNPNDIVRTYLLNEVNDFVSQDYWIASMNNEQLYGLVPHNGVPSKCYSMSLRLALSREFLLYPLEVNVLPQSEAKMELTHSVQMRLRYLPVKDAPHNGTTPLGELRHRWRHVAVLDEYLRPNCGWQCGLDIIILKIDATADPWEYYLIWAVRNLTSVGDLDTPSSKWEFSEATRREKRQTVYSADLCPIESLKDLARALYANDASRENKALGHPSLSQKLRAKDVAILKEVQLTPMGVCQDVDMMKFNFLSTSEKQLSNSSSGGIGTKTSFNGEYSDFTDEDRHRVFLFTTVLPTCLMVVLALLVALLVTCYLQGRSERQRHPHRRKGAPIIFSEEMESCRLPPSRPLILAHERPPVTPPYYLDEETAPLSVPSLPLVHGPLLHYNHQLIRPTNDLPMSHTAGEIYQFANSRVVSPHKEMTSPYLYTHSPRIMSPTSHGQANL